MSTPVKKSQIEQNGLGYKAKVSGSTFAETNQYAHTAPISPIRCSYSAVSFMLKLEILNHRIVP